MPVYPDGHACGPQPQELGGGKARLFQRPLTCSDTEPNQVSHAVQAGSKICSEHKVKVL